jgi:hypothetical protein
MKINNYDVIINIIFIKIMRDFFKNNMSHVYFSCHYISSHIRLKISRLFYTYLSYMHKNEKNGNLVAFYVEIFAPV